MFKIPINYYPFINQGHTIKLAGKIDPWRMYHNKAVYQICTIMVFPNFDYDDFLLNINTEYILLKVNGSIDYSVITSLN